MAWPFSKRQQDDPLAAASELLVAECGAFLSGRLAFERLSRRLPVRDWEWVNFVAHSTSGELREFVDSPPALLVTQAEARWLEAVGFLSGRILEFVTAGHLDLSCLQRSTLVPLELEMVSQNPGLVSSPGPTVRRVLERLEATRRLDTPQ